MELKNLNLFLNHDYSREPLPSSLVKIERLWTGSIEGLEPVRITMTAEERHRVRRRILLDGVEFGLALPTGTFLKAGNILYATSTKAFIVEAALEQVLVLEPRNKLEAAKVAHFIGNLHRDIDVQQECILVLYESALEIRLQKFGYAVTRDQRPFMGRPTGNDAHKL
jgi:urease accessory protein